MLRATLASVIVGAAAASLFACGTATIAPAPPPAAPVAAAPIAAPPPPIVTTTPPPTHHTTTHKPTATTHKVVTTSKKKAADSGPGCAQRAMAAGKFNPSCSEYQGYLDPGTSAGRAPNSGEIQTQYCREGGDLPAVKPSDC